MLRQLSLLFAILAAGNSPLTLEKSFQNYQNASGFSRSNSRRILRGSQPIFITFSRGIRREYLNLTSLKRIFRGRVLFYQRPSLTLISFFDYPSFLAYASGEFVVLNSPDSVEFTVNGEIEQSSLKEILSAALGYTGKQVCCP